MLRAVRLGWDAFGGWPLDEDRPGRDEDEALAERADLALIPVFEDERPFTGLAAFLDWRGSGRLTAWVDAGLFSGARGDRLLSPAAGELGLERLVLLGLGPRAEFDVEAARALVAELVAQTGALCARDVVLSWPGVDTPEAHDAALEALCEAFAGVEDAPRIWLLADEPVYTRVRGRLLGTPRPAGSA